MMRRPLGLLVLLALSVVYVPPVVPSWPAERVSRISFLAFGPPPPAPVPPDFPLTAFRHGLRELGYREGHTVILEERWAAGDRDRLRTMATELVQLPVDVIVTRGEAAIHAVTASSIASRDSGVRRGHSSASCSGLSWPMPRKFGISGWRSIDTIVSVCGRPRRARRDSRRISAN